MKRKFLYIVSIALTALISFIFISVIGIDGSWDDPAVMSNYEEAVWLIVAMSLAMSLFFNFLSTVWWNVPLMVQLWNAFSQD